ncbi:MAG: hypothetical protein ABFC24_10180 [Methanoregulaceae archaeon]
MGGNRFAPTPDAERRLAAFLAHPHLPSALEDLVFQYIGRKVQKPWNDPQVLNRIRNAVIFQKGRYWDERPGRGIPYGKAYRTFGYLAYHMPAYFVQTEHILADLARQGLLRPEMKILDVGTGPGVVPLAITDFYRRVADPNVKIVINAIERDEEHLEAYRHLVPGFAAGVPGITISPPVIADIKTLSPDIIPPGIDLMIFSNVLNELRDLDIPAKADIVMRLAGRLSPEGTFLITEPADKINSPGLRILSLALKERGLFISSPCSFIWGTGCSPESCWSFEEKPPLAPPDLMRAVAAGDEPYRFLNTDIKFSSVILRKDGIAGNGFHVPTHAKFARFSSLHHHTGRKVHVIGSVMSGELGNAKNHVIKICDGTAKIPVFAILPEYHRTAQNSDLLTAGYGTIVQIRNVLVRFNAKENAFNLFVNRETEVARISTPS